MKKIITYSLCTLFVLSALIASLIFILSGNTKNISKEKLDIAGNWVVGAIYENDVPTFTDNCFAVFSAESIAFYKENSKSPYVVSKYTLNDNKELNLTDISKLYKVVVNTENCIRLYENNTVYMLLIKNQSSELKPTPCTTDILNGKWEIKMKGDQFNSGELLDFNENIMSYYKDATTAPIATTSYTLSDDGILCAQDLHILMRCFVISDSTIIFIEENGVVWETTKIKQ